MTIQQRAETPTSILLMAFTRSKGKTSVNILVSNYTIEHITFNKGEYIRHIEPPIMDDMTIDDSETHPAHTITLQKMMAEQVPPDILVPPCHKLKPGIQSKSDTLLNEYETQFAKDETSFGTTSLTEMAINTGDSELISQRPYPIAMKNYQWVKDEIEKLLTVKVICSNRLSWSAPIIVVPKGDGGK